MSEPNIERAKALIVEADGAAPWSRLDILALMLTFAKEHAADAIAQASREGAIEELELTLKQMNTELGKGTDFATAMLGLSDQYIARLIELRKAPTHGN